MNVVSNMEAARPSERPVIFVTSVRESLLMIRKVRSISILFFFWFQDDLCATARTDIDFTSGTGETIAAVPVKHFPVEGGSAFVTQYDLYQFFHYLDVLLR